MKKLFLLVVILMIPLVQANLTSYPEMFQKGDLWDVKLVVGDAAKAEDTIAAIEIATSLQNDDESIRAVLASTIDDPSKHNLIVVGGACVNSVAAWLMDFPLPCTEGIPANSGIVQLFNFGDHRSLLVAGETAFETKASSRVLINGDLEDTNLMIIEPLAQRDVVVS